MLARISWFALFLVALTSAGDLLAQGKAKTDVNGDALPADALARMGTLRWRHAEAVTFVAYRPDGKTVLTAGQDNLIKLWERDTGKEIRRIEIKNATGKQPVGQPGGAMIWTSAFSRPAKVAMSEDGKVVAAVLLQNVIQLWDVDTGKELRQFKRPQYAINSLLFSPDGKTLAGRAVDRSTYLLDAADGKVLHHLKAVQPKAGGGVVINLGGGNFESAGVAFSRDGKQIATAELEFGMKSTTYLKISDTTTGKEIRRIDTTGSGTSAIAYSPDGKVLAYGSSNVLHLREADGGKEIRQINTPVGTVALAFAPDGGALAAKGRDQVIRLFDTQTGKSIHSLGQANAGQNAAVAFVGFGVGSDVRDFGFAPEGKVIAVASGPTLRFWTVQTGKEQPLAGGHRGAVLTVRLSADGKTLLSRGADGTIRRWDARTGAELGHFTEPAGTTGAAFAPDGQTVALTMANGSIRLCACTDGKELHQPKGHQNGAAELVFSADGKRLASRGNVDRTIRIYDVAKGTETKEIALPAAAAANPQVGGFGGSGGASGQGLVFSPDGQTIAANINSQQINPRGAPAQAGAGGTLHLWDVNTGKETRKIPLPAGRVPVTLAYSPNGRLLAAENADQTISLCEIAGGRERALLGKPVAATGGSTTVGGMIVIAGGNGFIRGAKVYTTLAFSPNGALLVSRGPSHGVRVWDVDFAKQVGSFQGHAGEVQSVSIAADGKSIASGSADTTILVWDLTRVKQVPSTPAVALEPKQLEDSWADLRGDDAVKAGQSIRTLASAPKATVPLLREQLKPAVPFDVKKIDGWIADLNSNNFQKRAKASSELEKVGELAIPALKKALASNPPVELLRRVEPILEKATNGDLNGDQLRIVRAVEVLEKIHSTDARQLLDTLAQGAPGALMTRQATTALNYLAKKAK